MDRHNDVPDENRRSCSAVTTFETELERDKADKIREVASRGAARAAELGYDGEAIRGFLRHYFRHVDALDVDERSVEELLGLVTSHYERILAGNPAMRGRRWRWSRSKR